VYLRWCRRIVTSRGVFAIGYSRRWGVRKSSRRGQPGAADGLLREVGLAAGLCAMGGRPLFVAWHFICELDLIGAVDRALPRRSCQQLSVGKEMAALWAVATR